MPHQAERRRHQAERRRHQAEQQDPRAHRESAACRLVVPAEWERSSARQESAQAAARQRSVEPSSDKVERRELDTGANSPPARSDQCPPTWELALAVRAPALCLAAAPSMEPGQELALTSASQRPLGERSSNPVRLAPARRQEPSRNFSGRCCNAPSREFPAGRPRQRERHQPLLLRSKPPQVSVVSWPCPNPLTNTHW